MVSFIRSNFNKIACINKNMQSAIGERLMLTYSMSDVKGENLYEYIYKCIKCDILGGKLSAGDKLPSKRAFAKNIGVSTITVESAYAQLIAEGYIYSIPKKGYYVTDITMFGNSCHIAQTKAEKKNGGILPDEFEIPHAKSNDATRYFADFVINRTNSKHFPFTTWARIMRDVISTWSEELLVSAPVGGVLKLREAISEHLRQFRGINVEASQIIVGAGTEYLYSLIIQLLGYGKVYALENPGYRKLYNVYRSHNTECIHIPMDGKGVLAKEIARRGADVVHISPSHHFPTGIIMPADRRYDILSWASEKEGRYIIEDDYDSEFRFSGKPVPALFGMDVNDRVIYMNTFTKSLASTIRISYMVLPRTLLNQFNSKLGFYSCTVSNFEQYTLAEFIKRGYFEKHINRMRNYYRKERDILIECIKKSSLANISVIKEENSGLHFLLQTKSSVSDEELIKKAAQSGIRISCLSQYYSDADEAPAHTVIINYSGISHEKIPEAIERLSKSISVQ